MERFDGTDGVTEDLERLGFVVASMGNTSFVAVEVTQVRMLRWRTSPSLTDVVISVRGWGSVGACRFVTRVYGQV